MLNVYRGGSLIQFLPDFPRPAPLEHRKVNDVLIRHDVTIEPDSILGQLIGKPVVNANTYHKQAVDRVGRGLRITARATDGIIEAIEDASMPLFVGVQWHPDALAMSRSIGRSSNCWFARRRLASVCKGSVARPCLKPPARR